MGYYTYINENISNESPGGREQQKEKQTKPRIRAFGGHGVASGLGKGHNERVSEPVPLSIVS